MKKLSTARYQINNGDYVLTNHPEEQIKSDASIRYEIVIPSPLDQQKERSTCE